MKMLKVGQTQTFHSIYHDRINLINKAVHNTTLVASHTILKQAVNNIKNFTSTAPIIVTT